ncbi:protein DpdD [Roseomonas indoligenes]|uniref:Uncharacterized protein n=1 Tax=Roseomonas indoligenes TaxID=2820811 RepID=A0A940SAJ9_9PROT|nr:protein DpdD [Pararoseomonas indoligenes]MBP0496272.1 hypothetical protein [Pararoseomonas indoligenes]
MIGVDAAGSALLVNGWKAAVGWDTAPAAQTAALDRIIVSASAPDFPGGILPWPRPGKRTVFYGVARRPEDWRRLRPLLVAFAGPTLTGFSGVPDRPNPKWGAAEAFLAKEGFAAVARLVPADDALVQEIAVRALERLCLLVLGNAAAAHRPPDATSRLLGRLAGALADGDRAAADALHARLRDENRLDSLNLRYLHVEICAAFRDWPAIAEMPELVDLAVSRRPAAVTAALLEALYAVRVEPAEASGEIEATLVSLAPLLRDLLADPLPSLGPGAARLADFARRAEPANGGAAPEPSAAAAEVRPEVAAGSLADDALANLIAAARSRSLDSLRAAVQAVDRLDAADRERLLSAAWARELWEETCWRAGRVVPPRNWIEWLDLLPRDGFVGSLDLARQGAAEWQVDRQVGDPASAAALADALLAVPEGIASERLAEALPVIIGWLRGDPEFPRPLLRPLYDATWTLLVLGVRRGQAELEASAALFDGLLSSGLPPGRYRELLSDALDMAGDPGRRSAYWLLGLVECSIEHPSPDDDTRREFWTTAVVRVDRFRAQLTALQQAALDRLAEALGIAVAPRVSEAVSARAGEGRLAGRRIAIYTLTESAGRQAAAALEALAPGVGVTVHADHVGTQALRAAAEGADIFVLVTWSAKHAATDFIRKFRPSTKPLLYASGRGATSILRALDEQLGPET